MKKIALLLALVFVGAGCADQLADDAVKPISAPLEARNVAMDMVNDLNAGQANQLAEAGESTRVAFVLPEGQSVPSEAMVAQIFGCNDRIAFLQIPGGKNATYRGEAALNLLLAHRESNVKGLYNPLSQSTITVDKVKSTDGVITEFWLSGELVSGGACDTPRIKAQIEETVRMYHPRFKIYLNESESAWRCFGDESGLCE